ncbi:NfeD family protein [Spongiibacter marinus]|uniref:NfeD family protein n=1 Tax=Spongiibacter marinus TaxID=354246 RepID=UPI0035621430
MISRKQLAQWLLLSLLANAGAVHANNSELWLMDIKGAIGPATADFVVRGIRDAGEQKAAMVVLRIDTPGGLDLSMRQIIKAILNAPLPVVCYVAPSGVRAASAGTYILYACHVAAMAPATNLGAATPVQIGAPGMPSLPEPDSDSDKKATKPQGGSMEKKIINDAVAYIQGLADLRQRNRQWAEAAVRDGASLAAEQALAKGVIDLIARDNDELLQQLNGREVAIGDHRITLQTDELTTHYHKADWRSEFLSVITDPNVAYVLLLVGIYGLIFEFSNPGMGVPGIAGTIAILLAMYAFQVLPISYAGLGLIFLGIGLMVAEAFAPSFGILGLGGIVAFVIGSVILMDTELPGYQIAWPIIAGVTTFSILMLAVMLGMLVKSRRHVVVSGLPHLVDQITHIETTSADGAYVWLDGERWQVCCNETLHVGDRVRINGADGLVLKVSKVAGEAS